MDIIAKHYSDGIVRLIDKVLLQYVSMHIERT